MARWADPGVRSSRIMMPALLSLRCDVFSTRVTRATIWPSPLSGWYA
jgi:hypothetical protein